MTYSRRDKGRQPRHLANISTRTNHATWWITFKTFVFIQALTAANRAIIIPSHIRPMLY